MQRIGVFRSAFCCPCMVPAVRGACAVCACMPLHACRMPYPTQPTPRTTPILHALQKDEFLRLAINAIHNDLISRNEAFQSLALTFVANSAHHNSAAVHPDAC